MPAHHAVANANANSDAPAIFASERLEPNLKHKRLKPFKGCEACIAN